MCGFSVVLTPVQVLLRRLGSRGRTVDHTVSQPERREVLPTAFQLALPAAVAAVAASMGGGGSAAALQGGGREGADLVDELLEVLDSARGQVDGRSLVEPAKPAKLSGKGKH